VQRPWDIQRKIRPNMNQQILPGVITVDAADLEGDSEVIPEDIIILGAEEIVEGTVGELDQVDQVPHVTIVEEKVIFLNNAHLHQIIVAKLMGLKKLNRSQRRRTKGEDMETGGTDPRKPK